MYRPIGISNQSIQMIREAMTKPICVGSYLQQAVNKHGVSLIVDNLVKLIRQTGVQFDTIVFRGMSGALIAPIIAYKMEKEILLIRKKGDDTHSSYRVEGNVGTQKFIIIDDLISSGNTMQNIFRIIYDVSHYQNGNPKETQPMATAQCQGIFLYASCDKDMKFDVRIRLKNDGLTPLQREHQEFTVPVYSISICSSSLEKLFVKWFRGNLLTA